MAKNSLSHGAAAYIARANEKYSLHLSVKSELGSVAFNRQRRNQEVGCRTTAKPFNKSSARARTGSRTTGFSGSKSFSSSESRVAPSRRSRTNSASLKRCRRILRLVPVRFVPDNEGVPE